MIDKKEDIFNCARELFYTKGYKETNIIDIAKMADIGVGTFYNYYDSKEELFLEVCMKENDKQKKSMLEAIKLNEDDPIALVTELVTQNLNAMNENPILKEWNNEMLASKLEQHFYEQGEIERIGELYQTFATRLIKKWKSEGKIRADLDDEFILAILNSVHYVDIHKKDIGVHHFPQIIRYLIEFIMKGLATDR